MKSSSNITASTGPIMTKLNGQLALHLLKRKSRSSILSQGFTLVELMIVIVIVGILSGIALPSFLSQQNKAKLTEASTKMSAILKAAHAEYQFGSSELDAITQGNAAAEKNNQSGRFIFAVSNRLGNAINAGPLNNDVLVVAANPHKNGAIQPADWDKGLSDSAVVTVGQGQNAAQVPGVIFGCINLITGKVDIDTAFKTEAHPNMNGTGGSTNIAALKCR